MLITYPYRNNLSAYTAGFVGIEGSDARDGLALARWGLWGLIKVPENAKIPPTNTPTTTPAKKLAQREAMCAISAKKLAQHAIKRPFWAILPALGEYFRAIAIDSRRWANFVAPILLTAPQDETASTNAGASVRLRETHDAFAR